MLRRPLVSFGTALLGLVVILTAARDVRACPTTCTLLGSAEKSQPTGSVGVDLGTLFTVGASYDLPNGTMAGSYDCACTGVDELIVARDQFRLNAAGIQRPVPIDVEVQTTTTIEGVGHLRFFAEPEGGPLTSAEVSTSGTGSFLVHLTMTPGDSYVLQFGITAYPASTNGARAKLLGRSTYRFLGVPAEASITSCQGFLQTAVPALASSWGSLKAAYR